KEIASWNVTGDETAFRVLGKPEISRDPFTLSRGELKRLLLACILSADADCLILDEPYSSLDSDAKEILTELLRARTGVTILFTHEMPNLDALFWEIREGRLCRM
ncbi:MAG TPA: ABC transporter, partial [Methanocorpusculum sp.]|nr:ABC transporter [Methanocorpusculum sp.]